MKDPAKDICQAVKVHLCAVTNRSALAANLANGKPYYFWLVDKKSNVVSNMAVATPEGDSWGRLSGWPRSRVTAR